MVGSSTKKLFLSYSRDDIGIARALVSHLKPLILSQKLEVFFDTVSLEKGSDEWQTKLFNEIETADAFIFLMSRSYFDSDYVINKELPGMIQRFRQAEGQVKFCPFYLSEYTWEDLEFDGFKLSDIQALGPFDEQERLIPLNKLSPAEQEKQFVRVYAEIKKWLQSEQPPIKPKPVPPPKPDELDVSAYWQRLHTAIGIDQLQRLANEIRVLTTKHPASADIIDLKQRVNQAIEKEVKRTRQPAPASSTKSYYAIAATFLIATLLAIWWHFSMPDAPDAETHTQATTPTDPKPVVVEPVQAEPAIKIPPPILLQYIPKMIVIKAGSFTMGSPDTEVDRDNNEGPQHKVSIKSFELGKTEVTFNEYDRFVQATKRESPSDEGWGRGNRPVINVSWDDATAYAIWLSGQTGKNYRLPTEAEWEYAARAGTNTAFSTGNCINTKQANYDGTVNYDSCDTQTGVYRQKTLPVDELQPNPWGLQHMHGNVEEWTQDCWRNNYDGVPNDGSALKDGPKDDCMNSVMVARGGSWANSPRFQRSAKRMRVNFGLVYRYLGFRLARTL